MKILKGKWLLMIILVIVFSGGRMALADGDHSKVPATSNRNMEGMDMSGGNSSDSHDMESMSGDQNTSDGQDMEGMDMEGSGSHSHEPVKEKPANLKVLGTFGAVNLSFIMIGVWNKWFRRKGDSNVNSKK